MKQTKHTFIVFIIFLNLKLKAQQNYSGNEVLDCSHTKTAPPSPSYLYTCNNPTRSCQSFLIFKSQPNYNTINTISQLFSTSSIRLSHINNISNSDQIFPINKELIIPATCSCLDKYYQANTSYVISDNDTYFSLATAQYQGLSSCNALLGENPYRTENLLSGMNLSVPLRCACPTQKQSSDGTKFLLTYSLNENDSLPDISMRFDVDVKKTSFANGFSEVDPLVFPLTTILIPLSKEPLSSQTIVVQPIEYPSQPHTPLVVVHLTKKITSKMIYLAVAGIVLVVVVLFIFIFLLWLRKQRVKIREERSKKSEELSKAFFKAVSRIDQALKIYSIEDLKAATKDFSSECKIQGSVYKGYIHKKAIAIKKVEKDVSKEANILYRLNHFNLISLFGICKVEESHSYLLYEYMENQSLKNWLQNPNLSGHWMWTRRVQIAIDIANGLDYIHNFTYPPYVHMDIKTSNILLNEKFRAKISNFSIARSTERMSTKNRDGTFGYLAPEYLDSGIISPKLDVYAFGVVMAELITGREISNERKGRMEWLFESIVCMVEGEAPEKEVMEFMEESVRNVSPIGLVMEVAKLCVACFVANVERRPSMNEVVRVLSRIQVDSQMWALAYR